MILIITNKADYTADFLILELHRLGIPFVRFNTEDFPTKISLSLHIEQANLGGSFFVVYGAKIPLDTIIGVWYRRPLQPQAAEGITDAIASEFVTVESNHALHAVWRLLSAIWVSHPDRLRVAESKPYQLFVAAQIGFQIPRTLITNVPEEARRFIESNLDGSIYKPLSYGRIIREESDNLGLIYTTLLDKEHLTNLSSVQYSPSLFQNHVPKQTEIRVTVVGSKIFAVELASQQSELGHHDWRRADLGTVKHTPMKLPFKVEQMCLNLVNTLGLKFGAIDLIRTPDDEFVFLEINANGQWAWIEQTLPEMKIRHALIELLTGQN